MDAINVNNIQDKHLDLLVLTRQLIAGVGAFWGINGLGWVQLRFHVTLGDVVTE